MGEEMSTGHQVGVFNGKTIPTFYNATTFRSRLEARWAVFFDQLGVRWFYEHEGFELPSGRYVPDFWLPEQECFVEIKPSGFNAWGDKDDYDVKRLKEFWQLGAGPDSLMGERSFFVFAGAPAEQEDCDERWYENSSAWANGDFHYLWCSCPVCGKFGIQFDGRGARVCGRKRHPEIENMGNGDKSYSYDDPRIMEAKAAAMVWRFA